VFIRQIKLGVQLNLPLVFHTREADDDTLKLVKENVPKDHKFHVHCYTSAPSLAFSLVQEFPNACIGLNFLI
jgi:TatD DNase family protein